MRIVTRARSWPPIATALAVQARVGELGGGFMASAVTLTVFLSLFPMLLLAIAVLGTLSAGDSGLAADLVSDLGLSGEAAQTVVDGLQAAERSRATTGVLGFLALVWTAIGAVGAIEHVCDRAWQLPARGLVGKAVALLWLIGALVLLGGSIAVTGLLAVLPGWLAPLQVAAGLALQVAFFLFTFRILTSRPLALRTHLPGAVLGALGVETLTVLATVIVPRQVESSSTLYGSIGVVLALLAWLLLFGRLLVYAVVLNVVRHERAFGTVRVEVEAPRFDGFVPVEADRSAVVRVSRQ